MATGSVPGITRMSARPWMLRCRSLMPKRPGPSPSTRLPSFRRRAAGFSDGGLAAMIGVLLESWTRPPKIVRLRYAAPRALGDGGTAATAAPAGSPERAARDGPRLPHIAAGSGLYARTLYAVDSDYPGPVVLELLQPPLAGAVAHGGFERVRQRLVLRLTSLTWNGAIFPVDAWAVDPECACYGDARARSTGTSCPASCCPRRRASRKAS